MNTLDSFWDVINNRRTVRQFRSDPVPEEHLLRIIAAARTAPCAGGEHPWKFIIVQDRMLIDTMRTECVILIEAYLRERKNLSGVELQEALQIEAQRSVAGYFTAPAYIVVLTDSQRRYPTYNQHDGPLAAGYALLAARALGYGTVYITDSIPEEVTRKVLNIPDRYTRVCVIPIGVPVEWRTRTQQPPDDCIVRECFPPAPSLE